MKEPIYIWDEEHKIATCTIYDIDNHTHIGQAQCHEDDFDFCSEKTGMEIAYRRALIEGYKAYRYYVKNSLKTLNQLYYTMKHSQKFNPKSYENKMLQRQIKQYEVDLEEINNTLLAEKLNLKMYIAEKDGFYKQIRAIRKKKEENKAK